MLDLIFLISLISVIIGKYEFPILRLDTDSRKRMLTIGKLGLGVAFGVLLYTESTNMLRGFHDGYYGK